MCLGFKVIDFKHIGKEGKHIRHIGKPIVFGNVSGNKNVFGNVSENIICILLLLLLAPD